MGTSFIFLLAHMHQPLILADYEPAWFLPALRRGIAPIHTAFATVRSHISLASCQAHNSQSYNMQCNDGALREYALVPLIDGTFQTEDSV
jgi:hypothetical protein